MSDEPLYKNLKVSLRHFPDYSIEVGGDGRKFSAPLPGVVQIGVEVDGVWVPLAQRKAAGLFADVERSKQEQADAKSDPPVAQPVEE